MLRPPGSRLTHSAGMGDEWPRVEAARHGGADVSRAGTAIMEASERIPWVRPIFDPDTWTMSPGHLDRLLAADPSIRLVVPVNVFGVHPDLEALRRAVERRGAALVLDNAHGFGTEDGGARWPRHAPVQAYSFHATK